MITPAKAEMIKGYPDAIKCTLPDYGTFVTYISGVLKSGNAIYFSGNGKQFLNITPDGLLSRKGASCDGKSLTQLREEGLAFDLVK